MPTQVLCARCHTDSEAGSAACRACGTELAVSDQDKKAAEAKRRGLEIAELRAKIATRTEADKLARAQADALKMSEAELDALRAEAGVATIPAADARYPAKYTGSNRRTGPANRRTSTQSYVGSPDRRVGATDRRKAAY